LLQYSFISLLQCKSIHLWHANVHIFRPTSTMSIRLFVLLGTGKEIVNPTKEIDILQLDWKLPCICSSNARHVVESLKGSAGLDVTSNAGICWYSESPIRKYLLFFVVHFMDQMNQLSTGLLTFQYSIIGFFILFRHV